MGSNYELVIRKIDEFIRKFYKNQLIKGLLYSIAMLASYYIAIIVLEYFSWFDTSIRSILFYTFLLVSAAILTRFVLVPLAHLIRLGKLISHQNAAKIIGTHFGEVKDVLLNTLQLHDLDTNNSSELIQASIDQKIRQLQPIPFADAVDLSKNRKYLRYALPPFIFIIAALIVSPSFIIMPSKRIINYNEVFERPAPFSIEVLNKNLEAIQQDDFTVEVKIIGDQIPDQLFIQSGQANYRMEKKSNILYIFTFRNLQQNTPFIIKADRYNSVEYLIKILPKPIILSFDIQADYPAYIGKKNEILSNTGDITIPAGTKLSWKFYTRDTRKLTFRIGGKSENLVSDKSNAFTKVMRMLSASAYSVIVENEYFKSKDSLAYMVNVIPDLYPSISMEEFKDSIYDNRLYYQGLIKDDYGLKRLTFNYSIKRAGAEVQQALEPRVKEIGIDNTLLQQQFFYFLDMSTLFVQPGDQVEYYFEVWDNDGVTGSKSTRSVKNVFKVPSPEEIEKLNEAKSENIKDKMESVIKQSKSLQNQVDDLQKKMVDKKEVGWQEKQSLQQLINKQQELQKEAQQISNENKEKQSFENQYQEFSPEIMEKQMQLQELFDKVLSEELKKMYEELEKMLEKIDKEKVSEMLEKMSKDSKSLEKELDRNLELFKQLDFEKKFEENIEKLQKLAEEQEKLSEETKNAQAADIDNLKKEQEDLNKKFDEFRDDMNELKKKNEELEQPNKMEETDTEESEIEQQMDNSSEEMKMGKPQKASKSQKDAGQNMKKLGEKLTEMKEEMEREGEGEDIEALRQILDNLVKISFSQEDLMEKLNVISTTNPKFLQIVQQQKNLKDDIKVVSDSLYALSKRQAAIEPFVIRELAAVSENVEEAIIQLNKRAINPARAKQQYAMTSVNNLAVMLADAMKNMQQNMQSSGSGKSSSQCKKPKAGQGKMKSMRQLQEQMNKQMQQMKEGMPKPGQKPSQGQKQISEEFARMAAQQEALRKQMQEYGQELQKQGSGVDKGIKEMLQQMEQTETDLVNKRINTETIKRQQEIVTRMLESEKAEQQREQEERRESEKGQDIFNNNPERFIQFNKLKNKETEMLRSIPPNFKPYYKSKVNAYFLSFE